MRLERVVVGRRACFVVLLKREVKLDEKLDQMEASHWSGVKGGTLQPWPWHNYHISLILVLYYVII